jgi:hypothetical protein
MTDATNDGPAPAAIRQLGMGFMGSRTLRAVKRAMRLAWSP